MPADQTEATGAASNLATADVQRVVDEQPKDLAAFGLAKPRVTVTFRVAGDKTPRTLLLGDKNPTGSDLYAKLPDAPRVFLVSAYLEGTFDKGVVRLPRQAHPHLRSREDRSAGRRRRHGEDDGGAAGGHVERRRAGQRARRFRRHRSGAEPARQRPDEEHRLGSGRPGRTRQPTAGRPHVEGVRPRPAEHRLTLGAGSTVAEILLGKATPEGDVYAKDASRSIVFTIEKALADDLARDPADFRSKDVFAFRAFTGTRLEITRAGKTIAFERKKGPEKDAVEKWMAVAPAPAADEAKIEDLVNKVATLRAESFVDALPAGATEFARIETAFDEGKKHDTVVDPPGRPRLLRRPPGRRRRGQADRARRDRRRHRARRHPEGAQPPPEKK